MFNFHCLVYPRTLHTVYPTPRGISPPSSAVSVFLSSVMPPLAPHWASFCSRVSFLLVKLNLAVWVGPEGMVLRQRWLEVQKVFIPITSVDGVEMEYNTTNRRKENKESAL